MWDGTYNGIIIGHSTPTTKIETTSCLGGGKIPEERRCTYGSVCIAGPNAEPTRG